MIIISNAMKHTFRYISSSLVLLVPVLANAQTKAQVSDPPLYKDYKIKNAVATGKTVEGPDNDLYTITLETFATGKTTLVDLTNPVDVVLVLDVSGSMDDVKGTATRVANNTAISYNTVANSNQEYFYDTGNGLYRIYASHEGNSYYLRYNKAQGGGNGISLGSSYSAGGTIITTSAGGWFSDEVAVYTGQSRMTALKKACESFIDEIERNDHEDTEGNERLDIEGNPMRLGNQIAIVKFAGTERTQTGNETYTEEVGEWPRTTTVYYNYTQIVPRRKGMLLH